LSIVLTSLKNIGIISGGYIGYKNGFIVVIHFLLLKNMTSELQEITFYNSVKLFTGALKL
jgi:hypothetical protein